MYEYEVVMAEYLTYLSGLSNIHNTDIWETRCQVFYKREISSPTNMRPLSTIPVTIHYMLTNMRAEDTEYACRGYRGHSGPCRVMTPHSQG